MTRKIFIKEVKVAADVVAPGAADAAATRALVLFRPPGRALMVTEAGAGPLTAATGSTRALFIPMTSRALVPVGSAETRALALAGPAAPRSLALFRPAERHLMVVAGKGGNLIPHLLPEFDAIALAREPRFTMGHQKFFKTCEDAFRRNPRGEAEESTLAELKEFRGEYKRQWHDLPVEDPLGLGAGQRPSWTATYPAVHDFLRVAITAVGGVAKGVAFGGTIKFTADMFFAYRNSTMTDDEAYARLFGTAKAKVDTWLTAVKAAFTGDLTASDIANLYPGVDVAALSGCALDALGGKEIEVPRPSVAGFFKDVCKAEPEALAVLLRSTIRSIDDALEDWYGYVKKSLNGIALTR